MPSRHAYLDGLLVSKSVSVQFGAGGAEARRFNRMLIDAGLITNL